MIDRRLWYKLYATKCHVECSSKRFKTKTHALVSKETNFPGCDNPCRHDAKRREASIHNPCSIGRIKAKRREAEALYLIEEICPTNHHAKKHSSLLCS